MGRVPSASSSVPMPSGGGMPATKRPKASAGSAHTFDRVILACHGDQALRVVQSDESVCVIEYRRRGWSEARSYAFSIEDAQRAGLLNDGQAFAIEIERVSGEKRAYAVEAVLADLQEARQVDVPGRGHPSRPIPSAEA